MVFFNCFAGILQHLFRGTRLNGCFHEDSKNKTTNLFSLMFLDFTLVMVISVWTHYDYDDCKAKILTRWISFLNGTANEKRIFD